MKMASAQMKDKATVAAAAAAAVARPPEGVQKCPRCDSANTKFCYYNNYSLSQPRHFCKTCRRYWTKGGALRNVPVGGGCRKNKRTRAASNSSSKDGANSNPLSSTDVGGLKFFQGFTPAMDFNLAGLNDSPKPTQISPFMDISGHGSSTAAAAINFSFSGPQLHHHQMGPPPPLQPPSIASSIESLSYINQDLHWKLQQQRLALLFGGAPTPTAADQSHHQNHPILPQKPSPQPLMFQNLEMINGHGDLKPNDHPHQIIPDQIQNDEENFLGPRNGGSLSTEWYFDNLVNQNNPATTSGSNINWNGMPGWSPYGSI